MNGSQKSSNHCYRQLSEPAMNQVVLPRTDDGGPQECLKGTPHTTMDTFLSVGKCLDQYTKEHSLRVSQLTGDFARQLGLAPEQTLSLQQAGLLHDIGKISIFASVLTKADQLTKSERARINEHAAVGGDLISRAPFLPEVSRVVRHHHERFDGAGYPDGVMGTEIPLGARILAVVDSFDAMIADRPYRKAFSARETLARLEQAKGTQLDPEIVDQFIGTYRNRLEL